MDEVQRNVEQLFETQTVVEIREARSLLPTPCTAMLALSCTSNADIECETTPFLQSNALTLFAD